MKKSLIVWGLCLTTLIAGDFKTGDLVSVKPGTVICFSKKASLALDYIRQIDSHQGELKINLKDGFCALTSYENYGKVTKLYDGGKYVLLDTKDYWLVTYTDSVSKQAQTDNKQDDNYKFVGIDELQSFPSDYIGKKLFIQCIDTSVEENNDGGYNINGSCLKNDGKYDYMINPFKLQIHINDKAVAKEIARNPKKVKFFLGTLRKNNKEFAVVDYIFEVDSVQYK